MLQKILVGILLSHQQKNLTLLKQTEIYQSLDLWSLDGVEITEALYFHYLKLGYRYYPSQQTELDLGNKGRGPEI